MAMIKFPFTSFQQFNLDWIMQKLHEILQFMPLNGVAGDVLQRTVDGAAWLPMSSVTLDIHGLPSIPEVVNADELAIYDNSQQANCKVTVQDLLDAAAPPVTSVNGQTGAVVLSIPSDTSDLTNGAGYVDAAGAAAAAPVQSVNGQTGAVIISGGAVDSVNGKTGTVVLDKTDIGLGNVSNVAQYSASNPPPYPVTSVNGMTGDVIVGGGGGGMDATLLWTNPSPTSTFPSQTVVLDLSSYKFVLIEYSQDYGFVTSTIMFPVPTITPSPGYSAYNVYMNLHWVSSQFTIFQRRCEITTASIVFEDATEFTAYNTSLSTSTNNNLGVPKRIWGIT